MRKVFFFLAMMILSCMSCISYADEADVSRLGEPSEYSSAAAENIVKLIDEYVQPYLATNTLTDYDNGRAIQCHAFTNYIWRNVFGYDIYSSKCGRTEASVDYELLGEYVNTYARPGDMLRVDGKHSMVITDFDENTVSGYDWLYNKKEQHCTYTWEGVKNWGDGTQSYWLYQIDDNTYEQFADGAYKIDKFFGPLPDEGGSELEGTDRVYGGENNGDGSKAEKEETDSKGEVSRGDADRILYGKIIVQVDNPVMTNNGVYRNIDDNGTMPMIVADRVVMPVRAVVEAMGGTVGWDNDSRAVTIEYKDIKIEMVIDSTIMKVNGKEVEMDVAPMIANERTMLPIRPIAESLGGQVEWFDSIKAATVTYEV